MKNLGLILLGAIITLVVVFIVQRSGSPAGEVPRPFAAIPQELPDSVLVTFTPKQKKSVEDAYEQDRFKWEKDSTGKLVRVPVYEPIPENYVRYLVTVDYEVDGSGLPSPPGFTWRETFTYEWRADKYPSEETALGFAEAAGADTTGLRLLSISIVK